MYIALTKSHSFNLIIKRPLIESLGSRATRLSIGLVLLQCLLVGCSLDPIKPDKENTQVYYVDIAPNGDEVAAKHSWDYVTTRNISTNEELCSWNTDSNTQLPINYSPNGASLLVNRWNDNLTILFGYSQEFVFFDTKTCERIRKYEVKGLKVTDSIEFSSDGKHIIRTSSDFNKGVVQIQKLESETGKQVRKWTFSTSHLGNDPLFEGVALSGDGTTLLIGLSQHRSEEDLAGGRDNHLGRVLLIDFVSGEVVKDWVESDTVGIASTDISFDGKLVVLGFRDGTVKTLDVPSATSKPIVKYSASVERLMISPDEEFVLFWSSEEAKTLVAYQLDSGEQVHEFQFTTTIHDFDLSRDGTTLVVGTGSVIEVVELNAET